MSRIQWVTIVAAGVLVASVANLSRIISAQSRNTQWDSGTVVVIDMVPDEIVLAADSRSHNQSTIYDDRCKITALGNQVIFAASGLTARDRLPDESFAFDVHEVARKQFDLINRQHLGGDLSVQLANAWGIQTKEFFQDQLTRHPDEMSSSVANYGLPTAVFASFDGNAPSVIVCKIRFDLSKGKLATAEFEFNRARANISAIGETGIIKEYQEARTQRSQIGRAHV